MVDGRAHRPGGSCRCGRGGIPPLRRGRQLWPGRGSRGLILGGPLLAVAVFGLCLLTLLKDWDLRARVAMSLMVAAALLDAIIIVLGLRAIGGSSFADFALYGLGLMSMAVLGAGAHVAISTADR